MRLQILFIAFILTACSNPSNETTIKGVVKGEIRRTIRYTSPINGFCNDLFTETINPDSSGIFSVSTNYEKPFIIEFLFGKSTNRLLVEPGKSYELNIYNGVDSTEFAVKNPSKAQVYYSSLPKLSPRRCVYSFGDDISSYEKISSQLNVTYESEMNELRNLLDAENISPKLYLLIKQDRNVYYQTAQSVLASKNVFEFEKNKKKVPEKLIKLREKAISQVDLTMPISLQSSDIYDFLYMYKWYFMRKTFKIEELKSIRATHRSKGTVHSHSIMMAKQFLPKECQEFYIASYITYYSRSLRKEKEFIKIMEQYKIDFPNSKYLHFFEDYIKEISTIISEQK
ncbi:hypothetical protein [Carboxylicivirga sp. RSCT41]|uniref:hypothetical protein n=1 Tax=Carboxylicivirga agarovorans TaxID=3417570 RepID=UPI003D3392C9